MVKVKLSKILKIKTKCMFVNFPQGVTFEEGLTEHFDVNNHIK